MRAIILAGGKGTRLLPHTERVPKPLVSIGDDHTILDILIKQLVAQGFTHITIAVNHLADMIIDYVGDGSKWGVKIDYSREEKPLHTIGPITLIPDLPDNFLVINGDTLTDMEYGTFLKEHIERDNPISISVKNREINIEFGVVEFDADNKLTAFKEKPTHTTHVSIGVNCISRAAIEAVPKDTRYGFDDLLLDNLARHSPIYVNEHNGFWLDIGRPADYQYAIENYADIKKLLKI
jgi:NDP-sugar pyrophosphorylase family protein